MPTLTPAPPATTPDLSGVHRPGRSHCAQLSLALLLTACASRAPVPLPETPLSRATPTPPPLGILTATNPAYPFLPAPTQAPAGLLTATNPAYPFLPAPTLPVADLQATLTAFRATAGAEALTQMAAPVPTNTPLPDGTTCYANRAAGYTLSLPAGWHAAIPWDTQINAYLYNYDETQGGGEVFQPGWQKIDLSVYPLPTGATFESWVEAERASEMAGDPPAGGLTDAQPYTLGEYRGVFYRYEGFGDAVLIKLSAGEKVISIALTPADSTAQAEALAMLATLDISGRETCG